MFGARLAATLAAIPMALVLWSGLLAAQDLVTPETEPGSHASTPARHHAARNTDPRSSNARASAHEGAGYYVDFRAIDGFIYGHTHIAYGRLNSRGQPIDAQYAGFEPDGGVLGAAVGHVAPVSGSIKTSKESVNFAIVNSYRRRLTAQQYRTLVNAVERAKKQKYVWNAVLHNCNDFMADMAHAIGLKAPPNIVIPYVYISAMRSLNGG